MFDFNEISPKTARLSGVLAQELNPQIYSSFAQSKHRGSQGQWEGGEWSPSTFIPLGHRWGGHTNPGAHRQTQTQGAENRQYECITAHPDGHLNIWHRHPKVQIEVPPAVTKGPITDWEKLQAAVWTTLGTIPGPQSPFSVLSKIKPAFEKNTS